MTTRSWSHGFCIPSWNCTRLWWLNRGLLYFFVALFGIFGACTNLLQYNSVRRVVGYSHLKPFMLFCYSHGSEVFQEDNFTSHKFRLVTGSLDELTFDWSSDFSVLNWPPRSRYLNPIEHLWDVFKQGMKSHHTAPTKPTELGTALFNIWQVIPLERF